MSPSLRSRRLVTRVESPFEQYCKLGPRTGIRHIPMLSSTSWVRTCTALATTAIFFCVLSVVCGFSSSKAHLCKSAASHHQYTSTLFAATTTPHKRQPFITGNWKLNPATKDEAVQLARDIAASVNHENANAGGGPVALFVPFPFIECVQNIVGNKIAVGAEMITPEIKGAFTGAISAPMLKSIGVDWVLAGHSERRTINKETDDYINAQCVKIIDSGMNVILCVGETLTEFEKNLAGHVCAIQLKKGLAGVSAEQVVQHVCIAYEPVWAIGTGKVATPEIAQEVHATCRGILAEMYGWQVANQIRILYGGSVGPDSVDGLMAKPDIDGCLVGGASLSADKFGRIINYLPLAPVLSPAASPAQEIPAVQPTISRLGRLTNSIKKILRKVV